MHKEGKIFPKAKKEQIRKIFENKISDLQEMAGEERRWKVLYKDELSAFLICLIDGGGGGGGGGGAGDDDISGGLGLTQSRCPVAPNVHKWIEIDESKEFRS